MRKSKYSDSQIASILQEAEAGQRVKEVCRQYGISSACYYQWKSKFGGMSVSELKRTRELEAENAKLKRMTADLALENTAEQLEAELRLPDILRTDNGSEFLDEVLVRWCQARGILIDYIEPGKLNQNVFIERFNRSYREEVLDTWLFRNLDEVRELTWAWMREYDEDTDHHGLSGLTPAEALHQARVSTFELST